MKEIVSYVADMSTLCGAEKLRYTEGKAKDVDVIRMFNGKISLFVNLDRCMDIWRLEYMGTTVSYITKNGLVSPKLTETGAYKFENSFGAGFMYTCGLDSIGVPSVNNGKSSLQHGCVAYIPAENVNVENGWDGDDYFVKVSGNIKYTALFGSKLVLRRTVILYYLSDSFEIKDEITNEGYVDDRYMIMYHTNIGYPLLDETAKLRVDAATSEGITCNDNAEECFEYKKPVPGLPEECFMHVLNPGKGVKAVLENRNFGLSLSLEFDTSEQPYLLEWKSMACADYVTGIEPLTTKIPKKDYTVIKPFETRTHGVKYIFKKLN